jgi:hypothetical protein
MVIPKNWKKSICRRTCLNKHYNTNLTNLIYLE